MAEASSEPTAPAASGQPAASQTDPSGSQAQQGRALALRRPTAITRNGVRQFVETKYHVRFFLQNCVATVNLRTKPDLAHIATHARNAEYNPRRFAATILRLREPKATGLVFSSGKMVITGARNEDDSLLAARKLTRIVQRLGFNARLTEFSIQNLVASGDAGYPIRLEGIADEHKMFCSYEPELFSGLIYRMDSPRLVVLVYVNGKLVVTGGKTRSAIVAGMEKMHHLLLKYRKATPAPAAPKRKQGKGRPSSIQVRGSGVSLG